MKKIIFILTILILCGFKVKAYKEYQLGEMVKYKNIDFYVIKYSSNNDDTISLLKINPLTVAEVNLYGAGHVNMQVSEDSLYYQTAYNENGYGGMQYYSSEECSYITNNFTDCRSDYETSDVKYVVDAWADDKLNKDDIKSVRLIDYGDIKDYIEKEEICTGGCYIDDKIKYEWLYVGGYSYYTMIPFNDDNQLVFRINSNGSINSAIVWDLQPNYVVRPVVELYKSAIGDIDDNTNLTDKLKNETKEEVKVPNTLQKVSIIIILLGVLLVSISIFIIVLWNKEKR